MHGTSQNGDRWKCVCYPVGLVLFNAPAVHMYAGCEIEATQACFLPMSPDGMPVIGPVPDVHGLYMVG